VNVAKIIAQSFKRFGKPVGVRPAVLIKDKPGVRTPGAITGGRNPTTETFSATGLIAEYSAFELQNTLITAGDRKILLFCASISGSAVPAPGDRIAIEDATYTIVKDGVGRDPAAATYVCQCRA
jgi:hypothetical protein